MAWAGVILPSQRLSDLIVRLLDVVEDSPHSLRQRKEAAEAASFVVVAEVLYGAFDPHPHQFIERALGNGEIDLGRIHAGVLQELFFVHQLSNQKTIRTSSGLPSLHSLGRQSERKCLEVL